jgi:hypothetical protein
MGVLGEFDRGALHPGLRLPAIMNSVRNFIMTQLCARSTAPRCY